MGPRVDEGAASPGPERDAAVAEKGSARLGVVLEVSAEDQAEPVPIGTTRVVGLDVLLGRYEPTGEQHGGEDVFQLVDTGARPVFLYYWKGHYSSDVQGWWFGNEVGGSLAWSFAEGCGFPPPISGWLVPASEEVPIRSLRVRQLVVVPTPPPAPARGLTVRPKWKQRPPAELRDPPAELPDADAGDAPAAGSDAGRESPKVEEEEVLPEPDPEVEQALLKLEQDLAAAEADAEAEDVAAAEEEAVSDDALFEEEIVVEDSGAEEPKRPWKSAGGDSLGNAGVAEPEAADDAGVGGTKAPKLRGARRKRHLQSLSPPPWHCAAKRPAAKRAASAAGQKGSRPGTKERKPRRPVDLESVKHDLLGCWSGIDPKGQQQWHKIMAVAHDVLRCLTSTEGRNWEERCTRIRITQGQVLWGKGEVRLDVNSLTDSSLAWVSDRGTKWKWQREADEPV